jgi:N6-L-threonylcarbamoyladenine synthase
MIDSGDDDLSFSGLKTAVYYHVRDRELSEQECADIAASAQEAIVDVLVEKTVAAAAREEAREVILTGGVAANTRLRDRLRTVLGSLPLVVPHPQFCTDNAAMIGAAAVLEVQIPAR